MVQCGAILCALSRNVGSCLQRGFLSMNPEEKRSKRCISLSEREARTQRNTRSSLLLEEGEEDVQANMRKARLEYG